MFLPLRAQRYSVGTNIISYANFLTLNAEMQAALSQKWSVAAAARYNPWTFNKNRPGIDHLQSRQLTFAAGARFWPWHVYSGWFFGAKAQYTKYNWGGITSPKTYEGDIIGANLSFGYSLMLTSRWNIDFGAGILVGHNRYDKYACPKCGERLENDKKEIYVGPESILVQISYLF